MQRIIVINCIARFINADGLSYHENIWVSGHKFIIKYDWGARCFVVLLISCASSVYRQLHFYASGSYDDQFATAEGHLYDSALIGSDRYI